MLGVAAGRSSGTAIVLWSLLCLGASPRSVVAQVQASRYPRVVAGDVVEQTLEADETVTYVYDGRSYAHGLDNGERYMLVEVRSNSWSTCAVPLVCVPVWLPLVGNCMVE